MIPVSSSRSQQLALILSGVNVGQEVYISCLFDRSRLKLLLSHPGLVVTFALIKAFIFLCRQFFLLSRLAGRRCRERLTPPPFVTLRHMVGQRSLAVCMCIIYSHIVTLVLVLLTLRAPRNVLGRQQVRRRRLRVLLTGCHVEILMLFAGRSNPHDRIFCII